MEDHRTLRRVSKTVSATGACRRLVNIQYSLVLPSTSFQEQRGESGSSFPLC